MKIIISIILTIVIMVIIPICIGILIPDYGQFKRDTFDNWETGFGAMMLGFSMIVITIMLFYGIYSLIKKEK
jgi:hypothetical protein